MQIGQLEYFVRAAELGSFTRAAERCLVSQPTLSQSIGKLERELGRPLFERLGRRVQLTDAGRVLLEDARRILALVDEAKSRVADRGEAGRVAVGAIPTVAPYLLPKLLKSFTRRYPQAVVEIHEEVTEMALRRCLAGELDLALLALPVEQHMLEVEPFYEEQLLLVMPPDHPLTRRKRLGIEDIQGLPFVLLNEAHCLSEQVVSFCRQREFQPVVTDRTNQLATIQELVALGHGISLVPAMAREVDRSRRRAYRSLSGHTPRRRLAMVWHRQRYQSRVVQAFIQTVRAWGAQSGTLLAGQAGGER